MKKVIKINLDINDIEKLKEHSKKLSKEKPYLIMINKDHYLER